MATHHAALHDARPHRAPQQFDEQHRTDSTEPPGGAPRLASSNRALLSMQIDIRATVPSAVFLDAQPLAETYD